MRPDTGLDCANPAGFVTLAPRQALTAAPNALFALNADRLDGLDSTAFLQSIPVPLTLSGNNTSHIILGENASTGHFSSGVFGRSTAGSGVTFGVWGRSASTSGLGVYGLATATSGTTYGVYGDSSSPSGRGVSGWATATSGGAWGVWGRTSSSASNAYGVYGSEPGGGAGHAVFASGTLAASGTKSFQIDHPLRPETHYLNHFCAEGPEPLNAYSGNTTTDAQGYATVQLPDYFEAINRDFRYQLTVIDDGDLADFVQVKVVRKIRNNQFTIRTSVPHVEVSWRVEAIRNDLYVQRYGFQTEQEKEDEIKGKYLMPELYGQPKERGIHYRPMPEPSADLYDAERERSLRERHDAALEHEHPSHERLDGPADETRMEN